MCPSPPLHLMNLTLVQSQKSSGLPINVNYNCSKQIFIWLLTRKKKQRLINFYNIKQCLEQERSHFTSQWLMLHSHVATFRVATSGLKNRERNRFKFTWNSLWSDNMQHKYWVWSLQVNNPSTLSLWIAKEYLALEMLLGGFLYFLLKRLAVLSYFQTSSQLNIIQTNMSGIDLVTKLCKKANTQMSWNVNL